jgi:hypothetical protein
LNGASTLATFTPAPGDVIKVKTKESATSAKVSLKDITQAMAASSSATSGATNSDILDGVDSLVDSTSGAQLPVPAFGTVHFTGGKIDGTTVGASGATAFDMNATGSQLQIKTSALTGGNAYTEKFVHA